MMYSLYSLNYNNNCKFIKHGISHFIQKYGIPFEFNSEKSFISISCKRDVDGEFSIIINDKKLSESTLIDLLNIVANNFSIEEFIYEDKNKIIIDLNIFELVGCIVSGVMERVLPKLDKVTKEKIMKIPFLDLFEDLLFHSVVKASNELNIPLVYKAFWPYNKTFAVCLTHDVDEIFKRYQYFTRFFKNISKFKFSIAGYHLKSLILDKLLGNNPYWTFDDIMEIEDELGVRSTFFFLNETAKVRLFDISSWHHYGRKYSFDEPELKKVMDKLKKGGWEVGLHGSYYSFMSPAMLKNEKKLLEKAANVSVVGIRQHCLNMSFPNTWKFQEDAGFRYDTSLGFKGDEGIGFRWGTCFPFNPIYLDKELSIVEIPLTVMDISISPENFTEVCEILNMVESLGGVMTVLWHHTFFNDKEYPGYRDFYINIIKLAKAKNAWLVPAREIVEWWNLRRNTRISALFVDGDIEVRIAQDTGSLGIIKIHKPHKSEFGINIKNTGGLNNE